VSTRGLSVNTSFALAKTHEQDAAVEFLTQVIQSEENPELSGLARSRLDKITGEKQRNKADKRLNKSSRGRHPKGSLSATFVLSRDLANYVWSRLWSASRLSRIQDRQRS
jgi:hypothetical protein